MMQLWLIVSKQEFWIHAKLVGCFMYMKSAGCSFENLFELSQQVQVQGISSLNLLEDLKADGYLCKYQYLYSTVLVHKIVDYKYLVLYL